MENAGEYLEIVGLMAVLGSGAIVFVTVAQWLAGKRRNRILLGAEMTAFFGLSSTGIRRSCSGSTPRS